jgi:hypothetical protein
MSSQLCAVQGESTSKIKSILFSESQCSECLSQGCCQEGRKGNSILVQTNILTFSFKHIFKRANCSYFLFQVCLVQPPSPVQQNTTTAINVLLQALFFLPHTFTSIHSLLHLSLDLM